MNIFISGAGSGIGAEIAKIFAQDAKKMILHAKTQKNLPQVAKEIAQKYPDLQVNCVYADLSQENELADLLNILRDYFAEGLDILVNNAGVFLPCDAEAKQLTKLVEYSWQVNVASVQKITQELLPLMLRRGGGHIFNMCSTASLQAYTSGIAYGISKYALKGFNDNLREELRKDKIKVTAIMPGPTWSNSWKGFEKAKAEMMQAEDIAKMVYMASKLSAQAVVEEIIMRPLVRDLKL